MNPNRIFAMVVGLVGLAMSGCVTAPNTAFAPSDTALAPPKGERVYLQKSDAWVLPGTVWKGEQYVDDGRQFTTSKTELTFVPPIEGSAGFLDGRVCITTIYYNPPGIFGPNGETEYRYPKTGVCGPGSIVNGNIIFDGDVAPTTIWRTADGCLATWTDVRTYVGNHVMRTRRTACVEKVPQLAAIIGRHDRQLAEQPALGTPPSSQ